MKQSIKRLGLLTVLLTLCLLATAAPATARSRTGQPAFIYIAGMTDQLDQGLLYPDTPELGNLTQLHWRFCGWMRVVSPKQAGQQSWWVLYDWSMVLMDKPDGSAGWHYHWASGIICTVDPSLFWPSAPPEETWLWTTEVKGTTTPAGVHNAAEYWTGCNRYQGLKAYCTWKMADPKFQLLSGKVWILD